VNDLKRKQIYLDEEMAERIERISKNNNISQAELIRRSIEFYLREKDFSDKTKDPILSLIGIVDKDIKHGSEEHDNFLYG